MNMARGMSDFNDEGFVAEDRNDVDVVIVGAGLTGLTIAYNILRRRTGLDVMIIEGRDDIGGRLVPGDFTEAYHASFLQKHISRLLDTLRIGSNAPRNTAGKKNVFYTKYGPLYKLSNYYAMQVHYFLRTIQENTTDGSFATYTESSDARDLAEISLDQLIRQNVFSSYTRLWCQTLMYTICGASNLDKVSSLWFLVMLTGAGGLLNRLKVSVGDKNRYFVEGGMTRVLQELLKQIQSEHGIITKSAPVTEILFNDDRVYVVTARQTFKCDYVVIAVPPPANSHISIEPPFPEHLSSSRALFTGPVNTFFRATYRQPFWFPSYTGNILVASNAPTNLNFAYDATRLAENCPPILAGYLKLPNSEGSNDLKLFRTLKRCFRSEEAMLCATYKEFDWASLCLGERISGSPMSVMMPGCHSKHVNCSETHTDRILLAASEYATNWPGTVDGAIEVGEKVATSILLKTKPQALNRDDLTFVTRKARKERLPPSVAVVQYVCLAMNAFVFYAFHKKSRTGAV